MKKLILFACVSLALLSCKKEPLCPTAADNTSANQQKVTDSKYLTWHDNGGSDFGCWDRGGNCGHTITVSATAAVDLNNIFAALNTGNNVLIRSVFEQNRTYLSRLLPSATIDAVITGKYNAKARGTDPAVTRYILIRNAQDSGILFVYPFELN
jgi:hypothetical protein